MKLYGSVASRGQYCLWLLEEIGVAYDHVNLQAHTNDTETAEYRALNPNGTLPTLVDGDLVMWESMAINLYLAEKYGGGLWPEDGRRRAHAVQWTFWVMTEVERALEFLMRQHMAVPEEERDQARMAESLERLERPMGVLEAHLRESPFILGAEFTVADLNVAAVLGIGPLAQYDYGPYPAIEAWLAVCLKRPARARMEALA